MGKQLNSRLWTLVFTSRGPERWFAIVEFFTFTLTQAKRHSITLQRPRCRERAFSSVGESTPLIRVRPVVRVHERPLAAFTMGL